MNDEAHKKAESIGEDMPLAALDLLAGVKAPNAAALGGLDALAVDDAGARAGLTPFQFTCLSHQMPADRLQKAAVAPIIKVALHRRIGWEVPGQQRPRTTARRQIQDRIHDLPQIRRPWPADRLGPGQERRNQCPFPITQIA